MTVFVLYKLIVTVQSNCKLGTPLYSLGVQRSMIAET